jgi:hypothetical protein
MKNRYFIVVILVLMLHLLAFAGSANGLWSLFVIMLDSDAEKESALIRSLTFLMNCIPLLTIVLVKKSSIASEKPSHYLIALLIITIANLLLLFVVLLVAIAFSGPGFFHILIDYGVLFCCYLLVLRTVWLFMKKRSSALISVFNNFLLIVISLASFWSLGVAALVSYQSVKIANDKPYCLAIAAKEITSLWQLRGADFYTTATGYKDSSRWYFHGLLKTYAGEWNWSSRLLRFESLYASTSGDQDIDPDGVCQPKKHFINGLLIKSSL